MRKAIVLTIVLSFISFAAMAAKENIQYQYGGDWKACLNCVAGGATCPDGFLLDSHGNKMQFSDRDGGGDVPCQVVNGVIQVPAKYLRQIAQQLRRTTRPRNTH